MNGSQKLAYIAIVCVGALNFAMSEKISLYKPTLQRRLSRSYVGSSEKAVDESPLTCVLVNTLNRRYYPAWWQVDLVERYVVTEVNIFVRTVYKLYYLSLERFIITVTNTNTTTATSPACVTFNNRSAISNTRKPLVFNFTCTNPAPTGRYVTIRSLSRVSSYRYRFPLCDVSIFGRKHYDCSLCGPNSKQCNTTHGCDECQDGKQPPSCTLFCTPGTYGKGCKQSCGRCLNNASCDVITGACPTGCELFYTDATCDRYIAPVSCRDDISNYGSFISQTMRTSVQITWYTRLPSISGHESYYGYLIQYIRRVSRGDSWTDGPSRPHVAVGRPLTATVTGLLPLTEYFFRVVPYRRSQSEVDLGLPCKPLFVSTTTTGIYTQASTTTSTTLFSSYIRATTTTSHRMFLSEITVSPFGTTSPNPSSTSSCDCSNKLPLIILGVVAGLLILVLIILVVVLATRLSRLKKNNQSTVSSNGKPLESISTKFRRIAGRRSLQDLEMRSPPRVETSNAYNNGKKKKVPTATLR